MVLEQGIFTLKEMQDQMGMILQLGPISKVMGMMPGMNSEMFRGSDAEVSRRLKGFMAIMDSMSKDELASDGKPFQAQPSRILRVARGSGTKPSDVADLLGQYKTFAQLVKKLGGKGGLLSKLSGGSGGMGGSGASSDMADYGRLAQQLHQFVPSEMLQHMGGIQGLQGLFRQIGGAAAASANKNEDSSSNKKTRK